MRYSLLAMFISMRLAWGRLLSPMIMREYLPRFFPPPRKAVYKKGLANYFFRN